MGDPHDEIDDGFRICPRCMGGGYVDCHCGGDLCVCENQGEAECPLCGGDGEITADRYERYFASRKKFAEVLRNALLRNSRPTPASKGGES